MKGGEGGAGLGEKRKRVDDSDNNRGVEEIGAGGVEELYENQFGISDWHFVFAAPAAYVIVRRHPIPLSVDESVAAAAGCDERQIKQMVGRIIAFLEMEQLLEFDEIVVLDRAVRMCACFGEVEEEEEEVIGMERFFIRCMMKWFLMTGKRSLPAVAAVAAFVVEVSGLRIELEESRDLDVDVGLLLMLGTVRDEGGGGEIC